MKKTNLDIEGISQSFVDAIDITKSFSPVQMEKDGPVATLVKCSTGFWISYKQGVCVKENGKYVVINEKQAKIGRARYLFNFKDQIKQEQINDEYEKLKNLAITKANELLHKFKVPLLTAGLIDKSSLFDVLHNHVVENDYEYKNKVDYAKEVCEKHDLLNQYNRLKELIESQDYDTLYVAFVQEGLPMLGSFNSTNMAALSNLMHKTKVDETISELHEKGHLYMVAKINVEKRENLNQ